MNIPSISAYISKNNIKAAKLWIQGSQKDAFVENGSVYYKTPSGPANIFEKAKNEGKESCMSHWLENNILNITYNPHMHNAPIRLVRDENKISISAALSFYESLADAPFSYTNPQTGATSRSKKTHSALALEGIRQVWQDNIFYSDKNNYFGDYDFVEVNFNISTVANNSHLPHFKISIKETGQPICMYNVFWKAGKKSLGPVSDIVLCNKFKAFGSKKITPEWEESFKYQAAHEFGHVLGLGDAYGGLTQAEAPKTPAALEEVPADEVMRSGWHSAKVYPNTIEMILEAFKTSALQKYDPGSHSAAIKTY